MDTKTVFKRLMCAAMVALTILTSAPLTGLVATQAQAAIEGKEFVTTTGALHTEYALFPIQNSVRITRTNNKLDYKWRNADPNGGHVRYAFDFVAEKDKKFRAPFDLKLLYVDKKNNHAVVFQSIGKVRLANGNSDFVTGLVLHDDDVKDLESGQTYNQGEHFYTQGNYGNSTGAHIHVEMALGKLSVNKNNYISVIRKNGIHANQVFLLTDSTTMKTHNVTNPKSKKSETIKWERVSNVSFNANGGTVSPASHYYQVNKNYTELPTPKRNGYKFTGWYTAKTGGTKITVSSNVTKGNKTLYARWSIIDKNKLYYVQYNANGGSGSMSRIEVIANEYFLSGPNRFTKNGYTLKGWNLRRKSDNKWYISGKGWKSDKQIKLYKYDKKLFKDNYKYKLDSYWTKGSGKNDTFVLYAVWNKCTSHKWDAGKVTTAATTMKTGVKTFTCTNCKSTKTQTIAKLTTDSYFSKVYANNIKSNDAKIGAKAKSTAQKKGTGFYLGTSKDSMKRYTKNLKGKGDGAGTYTDIFFTLSGWYGKLKPGTTYYYSVFYIDKNGKECASVIKSFKTSGTASSSTATAPATKTFTYAYNANGGNGTMSSQKVELNKSFTVKANEFKRSGYTFTGYTVKRNSDGRFFVADKGWKTESEISGNKWTKKLYAPGVSLNVNSSWQNGSKTNETFTFYAQWKKNSCTSHCWDGGKVTTAPTTVKTGINTHTCSECGATTTTVIERSTTEKYFSSVYANSITSTSAKIGANAKSKEQKKGTGFYLGTSKDSMKRYTKNLKGGSDAPGTYTEIFFPLNNWYGKLKPKTTYYYSIFYLDKNGKECASVIKSFKTK